MIEVAALPIFQARNVQKSCSQMLPQDSRKNLSYQPLADLIDGNELELDLELAFYKLNKESNSRIL